MLYSQETLNCDGNCCITGTCYKYLQNTKYTNKIHIRGHSTNTWTEFCHFLTLPSPLRGQFYTLSVDKKRKFWEILSDTKKSKFASIKVKRFINDYYLRDQVEKGIEVHRQRFYLGRIHWNFSWKLLSLLEARSSRTRLVRSSIGEKCASTEI